MSNVEQRAKEEAAAKMAQKQETQERKKFKMPGDPGADFDFIPGKPLPEGFVNPPFGDYNHRCVDKAGNYDPTMFQFILNKTDPSQATRQYMNNGKDAHYVMTDVWMDAPAYVVSHFQECVIEETEMVGGPAPDNVTGLTAAVLEARVVRKIPRFHIQAIRSA